MRTLLFLVLALGCFSGALADEPQARVAPLFRDFMGINGHTVQFKPELYKQVGAVVRDYHPLEWDTGPDSDYRLDFPFARNRVNWEQVYGGWRSHGFYIDACIMFETIPANQWKSLDQDAYRYGKAFAEHFGPSSPLAVVDAVEIGNEPGKFTDAEYQQVFTSMAKGLRAGDARLKIATCNVNVGPSGDYHKSVECVADSVELFDVLTIHSYALLEGWPTWRRSFPEDAALPAFTQDIDRLIEWRDTHAPGKEIWLTEFGWDCSTRQAKPGGTFEKWVDNTDVEQAQWLVRTFFAFAKRDVQRAFIYFFNDEDAPEFHGSSGITRNFEPKPSFYALTHLYQSLGDYRFSRVVQESTEDGYVYEFAHDSESDALIWVVWSATGVQRSDSTEIDVGSLHLVKSARMPISAEEPVDEALRLNNGKATVPLQESPLYIWLKR